MAMTIHMTGGDAVIVIVDPASDGAREVNGVANQAGSQANDPIGPDALLPPSAIEANRRAHEDAAIDAEDFLTQADEANDLDPVG